MLLSWCSPSELAARPFTPHSKPDVQTHLQPIARYRHLSTLLHDPNAMFIHILTTALRFLIPSRILCFLPESLSFK